MAEIWFIFKKKTPYSFNCQHIPMFSRINGKLSQSRLNDMAEHRPILKNNQNTIHPRFGFTPKTGIAFPKTGFYFYCEPCRGLLSGGKDHSSPLNTFHRA